MSDARDPLLDAIVAWCDRAPVSLASVVGAIRSGQRRLSADGAGPDVRAATLALLREALRRRKLIVGSLDERGALTPWPLSAGEALARIDAEWAALERDPREREIAGLATPGALGYS